MDYDLCILSCLTCPNFEVQPLIWPLPESLRKTCICMKQWEQSAALRVINFLHIQCAKIRLRTWHNLPLSQRFETWVLIMSDSSCISLKNLTLNYNKSRFHIWIPLQKNYRKQEPSASTSTSGKPLVC